MIGSPSRATFMLIPSEMGVRDKAFDDRSARAALARYGPALRPALAPTLVGLRFGEGPRLAPPGPQRHPPPPPRRRPPCAPPPAVGVRLGEGPRPPPAAPKRPLPHRPAPHRPRAIHRVADGYD